MTNPAILAQNQAASNPATSVWVSANAGAGKTHLLTQRVLRLLLNGSAPSRILCLTFTKAASAEMKERIHRTLAGWVMAEDSQLEGALLTLTGSPPSATLKSRARRLFAEILDAPEGPRLQTIHSFCQSLLKRFPVEAGMPPHFTVIDERTSAELLHEARLQLYQHTATQSSLATALANLAGSLPEMTFKDLLGEIIAKRSRITAMLNAHGSLNGLLAQLPGILGLTGRTDATQLLALHFTYPESHLTLLRQCCDGLAHADGKDALLGKSLSDWLCAEPAQRHTLTESYLLTFLTKAGTPRKKLCRNNALPPHLLEVLLAEQQRVVNYAEALNAAQTVDSTADLLTVADALLGIYRKLKRDRAFLDYDDLILQARQLLLGHNAAAWVLYKLDGGLDHILVDEAQDTSLLQWEIVTALTEEFFAGNGIEGRERTLFVVGDEKQSIFSFQGADPQAFSQMRQYFANKIQAAGQPFLRLPLARSFRSGKHILQAVDAVFADAAAHAGVTFDGEAIAHEALRQDIAGHIEVWPVISERADEPTAAITRLAGMLADTIAGWLKTPRWLEDESRPLQPGDIMILLRRREAMSPFLRALKRRNVPVVGIDQMNLREQPAVQDLLALGQFLLLPQDDYALACVLKSPLFGINEEQLFTLAHGRAEEILWQRLRADQIHYPGIVSMLEELLARVDYLPPYELYTDVLYARNGRQQFIGRMGEEVADALDEFLEQALLYERAHIPSLQGFLHWLSQDESKIKREMAQPRGEVRILTVHGSKGLEAPIVILADTMGTPTRYDRLLWHDTPQGDITLWSPREVGDTGLTRALKAQRRESAFSEYRRLLYVAMTRARESLIVCGWDAREREEDTEPGGSVENWYKLIENGLKPLTTDCDTPAGPGIHLGNSPLFKPAAQHAVAAPPIALPAWFSTSAPAEPSPTKPLTPSRLLEEEPGKDSPLLETRRYLRGTVMHRLLQHVTGLPPEEQPAAAERLLAGYEQDFTTQERSAMQKEALTVMRHPEFSPLFAPGSMAEIPLTGIVHSHGIPLTVSGQIDRLIVLEDTVLVVDYKTGRYPPQAAQYTPPEYIRQMAAYRALLKEIYPRHIIRCALLWTNTPALIELPNSLLDTAALDEARFAA